MMQWSIRSRLTAWYSLVLVVVLVTGALAVALLQQRWGLDRLDGELGRLLLTLEGVMRTEFGEGLDLEAAARAASLEVVAPDRTLQVLRPDGRTLQRWGRPLEMSWTPPLTQASVETITVGDRRVRALSRPLAHNGQHYVATVMAPLDPLESEHRTLLTSLVIGVVIALATAALGGWTLGRVVLQPLTDLAAQAAVMSESNPTARLQSPHHDDEVGRFARAFNALLDRLAAVLHGQRQFMADASHELRTPVSVIRTTSQVILSRPTRPETDYRDAMTIVEEQSARLARLVDAMFLLSRAEARGITLAREPLYLDDLADECVRALKVLAEERRIDIRREGDDAVSFSGDGGLLKQMIGNLVDNAIRHARDGGAVTVRIEHADAAIAIRVGDDGEGVAPENRERIFERFARFAAHSTGAGLGLPIARGIAEAHGGSLILETTGSTGSCFTARLPSTDPDIERSS